MTRDSFKEGERTDKNPHTPKGTVPQPRVTTVLGNLTLTPTGLFDRRFSLLFTTLSGKATTAGSNFVLPFPRMDPQVQQVPKPIRVDGYRDFQCALGWTVEQAEERIRSSYPIVAGCITNNGIVAASSHVIEATGDYEFVITQAALAQTGKRYFFL